MVNAGSPYENATSIQDFSGASVLGQRDTMLDVVIDQIEGVNHLTAVSSVPDMIARLNQGACDAITVNMESIWQPILTLLPSALQRVKVLTLALPVPVSAFVRVMKHCLHLQTKLSPLLTRKPAMQCGTPL